jgi:arginyl-tRNA synthetase
MPLARALKKNPRELAQALVERLRTQPAVQRWVQALEIAGPGFVNLRLKPAAGRRWWPRCCAPARLRPRAAERPSA